MALTIIDEMEFFRFKVCKKCFKLRYQKGFVQSGNKDLCKCEEEK